MLLSWISLGKKVFPLLLIVFLNTSHTRSAHLKNISDLTQLLPLASPHSPHNRPHNYAITASTFRRLHVNTTFTELHLQAQFHISFCVTYKHIHMLPAALNGSLRGFSLCQQQEGQRGEGSGSPSSTAQPIIKQITTHRAALSSRSASSAPHNVSTASWNDLCPLGKISNAPIFGLWCRAKEADRQFYNS